MMTKGWSVDLYGDQAILQSLCDIRSDSFWITKENGQFVLKSDSFEKCGSNEDVHSIACDYIEKLNAILFLRYDISSAIKVGGETKVDEHGRRHIFLTAEPGRIELRGYEPTITITKSNGETIVDRPGDHILLKLRKSISDPKVNQIFKIIQDSGWEFGDLVKILEVLLSAKGSKLYEWVPEKKIDLLKHTANHPDAIGVKARHGVLNTQAPKNPMTIEEARDIVKALVHRYIDDL